jgi:hypothetical protein
MITGLTLFMLGIYLFQRGHPGFGCCALAGAAAGFVWPGWWMPR